MHVILCGYLMCTFGVMLGCSDDGDDGYRVWSDSKSVPTVHLVFDEIKEIEGAIITGGDGQPIGQQVFWQVNFHVQSDYPMKRDTFVLVNDSREGAVFIALLAGRTQSSLLEILVSAQRIGEIESWDITLPPPHERANLLPATVYYRDSAGIQQRKQLLVEHPFNQYQVGQPDTLRVKDVVEEYLHQN